MTIPFRVKKLTKTTKVPHRNCESDLWDLYADGFEYVVLGNIFKYEYPKDLLDIDKKWYKFTDDHDMIMSESKKAFLTNCTSFELLPSARILVKTGVKLELPKYYSYPKFLDFPDEKTNRNKSEFCWVYDDDLMLNRYKECHKLIQYAVADIRPRSGLALKHGITVLNSPATIDSSYRKEIGVILHNAGHEPYTITKGDKIAQMLIRPLYPSKMEIVKDIEDTGRGAYGSTGK